MAATPEFRFRLNGVIIPEIRIERAKVEDQVVDALQLLVRDAAIGWFRIDDNAHLCDRSLSKFLLEYRNETEWQGVDPIDKRLDPQKGWHRVSPHKLMKVLQSAGLIDIEELRESPINWRQLHGEEVE